MDPLISGLIFETAKYLIGLVVGVISYHVWWKSTRADIIKGNDKQRDDLLNSKTKQEQEDATKNLADHSF